MSVVPWKDSDGTWRVTRGASAPLTKRYTKSKPDGNPAEAALIKALSQPGSDKLAETLLEATRQLSQKGVVETARQNLEVANAEHRIQVARDRTRGFSSFGDQMLAILRARSDNAVDSRLTRGPTGASESDPSGGGFLVSPQWGTELVAGLYEESYLAPLCDRRPTSNPLADVRFPGIDESSRVDGSRWGGGLAYWSPEADSITTTLPRFKTLSSSPKKLIAICFGTNEMLNDVPLLDSHLRRVFALEMAFKLDLAILSGTGAGVPQGILNSSALITVAKASGQASATILADNITAMWKRLPAPSRRKAVWLINESAEEQLDAIEFVIGGTPMFAQAGTNGSPVPLLKGRPVYTLEQSPALGSVGDIILADLSHYLIIDGGMQPSISADVAFTTDQVVWRFVMRVDSQSAFTSPITPYVGSVTRSPFVCLASR